MTVRIPPENAHDTSSVYNVDFRETAPALSHPRMYPPGSNSSKYGGKSVAIPGELRGLEEAHKRWGTLPWKRLFQPSIDLAAGWQVDKELGIRIPVRPFSIISSCDVDLDPVVFQIDVGESRLEQCLRSGRTFLEGRRTHPKDELLEDTNHCC